MRQIFAAALLSVCAIGCIGAQTASGRIAGTVSDSSGAIIPNASITVKNENTGEERKASTDGQGRYIVAQLVPASYAVAGASPGLSQTTRKGIVLQVGQERQVDLILNPATVSTEVTVSAGELASVETSSAKIGVNVSSREVAELPLNGRQISQLYLLTPGAVNYGSGSFDDIRFSGRSNEQNIIRFDGVEGTSIIDTSPGNLNGETSSQFRLQTSLENVQEFRVDSNSYPAEYGTGTGGQISVITKSGTNALHGDLFEFLRNDALDARNFFDAADKSKLRLNQFGGSLGGPLVRDKLFVFGSFEALRQRTGVPIVESTLSAAAKARAVPAIRPVLEAFPVGQFHTSNPDLDIATVTGRGSLDENAGGIRFDYNLSEKYRMYMRYFRDQGDSFNIQNSTGSAYVVTAVPQNAVWNLQQVLTPTTINETKVGFNGVKTRISGIPPIPILNGVTINPTGSVALAGIAGQTGSAGIGIPTGLVRTNSATNGRGAPYTNYSLSLLDTLNLIRGSHNVKFGVEFRPITLYTDRQGGITYSFPSVNALLSNQPSQIQFLGDVSALSPFTGLSGQMHLRQNYYIGYVQDEWKATPNLTVNYGLRYEYYSPLHETRNKNVYFNLVTGTLTPRYKGDWFQSSPYNFGPRLALSWSPQRFSNRTVFRIGAGYYYGPGQTEDQLQPAESDRVSTTISGSNPLLAYPLNTAAVLAGYDVNSPALGFQPRAYAPGYRIPEKILQYTASVEQQLPFNTVLMVAYVGSQGRNLFLRSVTNKISGVNTNPVTGAAIIQREFGNRFAEIDYKTSGGTSHYNALQTTLNRRFTKGLTLGAQYTYAHDIGNTGGSNEARTAANNYSFRADYGNNTFDVRQSANVSALYDIPFGIGRAHGNDLPAALDLIAGGWQLGGILNARSGLPIEVLITRPDVVYQDNRTGLIYANPVLVNGAPVTTAIVNVPGGGNTRNVRRPDYVAGVNPYAQGNRLQILNPAAFTIPRPGSFGNLGRDAFHGPNLTQFDLTLAKRFRVSERLGLEFRSEFYNILNHANFQNPGGGIVRLTQALPSSPSGSGLQPGQAFSAATAGPSFGAVTQTVSNQIGLGTNRQIQLALRFLF